MKLAPMRFDGFSWRHNPREIRFECEKQVCEKLTTDGGSLVSELGGKAMVIRGEGELYGSDCAEQFAALLDLYKSSGEGVLVIDRLLPIRAVFEELRLLGQPREDVLTYSFVFREAAPRSREAESSCAARPGETLWDISYRFKIPIDTLVRLNPGIRRPDDELDGRSVFLA